MARRRNVGRVDLRIAATGTMVEVDPSLPRGCAATPAPMAGFARTGYPDRLRHLVALKPGHIPTEQVRDRLERLGPLHAVGKTRFDGPAERYKFDRALGEVGFISPMTNHFCASCNRLRLTAEGKLRPCLLSDRELDVRGVIRGGANDEQLAELLKRATFLKPAAHALICENSSLFPGEMSTIGG